MKYKFLYEETRLKTIYVEARDGLDAIAKLNKMADDGINTDEKDFLGGKILIPLDDECHEFALECYGETVKDSNVTDIVLASW